MVDWVKFLREFRKLWSGVPKSVAGHLHIFGLVLVLVLVLGGIAAFKDTGNALVIFLVSMGAFIYCFTLLLKSGLLSPDTTLVLKLSRIRGEIEHARSLAQGLPTMCQGECGPRMQKKIQSLIRVLKRLESSCE